MIEQQTIELDKWFLLNSIERSSSAPPFDMKEILKKHPNSLKRIFH